MAQPNSEDSKKNWKSSVGENPDPGQSPRKFNPGDEVVMSVENAPGYKAPKRFKILECERRGMDGGWQYQLSEVAGTTYKPGEWFDEGDMRLQKSRTCK